MDEQGTGRKYTWIFLIITVLATVYVEQEMITVQSYDNFATALAGFQAYIVVLCLILITYAVLFRRRMRDIIGMIMLYSLFFVIPIGTLISLRDGYTPTELFSWNWMFTHDFVYVLVVCQAFLTWVLLVAMTDRKPSNSRKEYREDEGVDIYGER